MLAKVFLSPLVYFITVLPACYLKGNLPRGRFPFKSQFLLALYFTGLALFCILFQGTLIFNSSGVFFGATSLIELKTGILTFGQNFLGHFFFFFNFLVTFISNKPKTP
jgi:hypothetical protein